MNTNKNDKNKKDMTKKARKLLKKCQMVDMHATFSLNNTIITVTGLDGNPLFSMSPPQLQRKPMLTGPRKGTPFAAQEVMKAVITRMQENHGVIAINNVFMKGPGAGRDVALRSIRIPVAKLIDISPIVHNGCRAKAPRSK